MSWDELYTKIEEPSLGQIDRYIGSPLWKDLQNFLETIYSVQPKVTYSNCSAQKGWNVKYQKSGKSLCTLYPMPGYFIALVVVGAKESTEAELLMPFCTDYVQELFARTRFSAGGKWLMIDVTDADILEDVKRLIEIRVRPK